VNVSNFQVITLNRGPHGGAYVDVRAGHHFVNGIRYLSCVINGFIAACRIKNAVTRPGGWDIKSGQRMPAMSCS
jgi:hypothetical protein